MFCVGSSKCVFDLTGFAAFGADPRGPFRAAHNALARAFLGALPPSPFRRLPRGIWAKMNGRGYRLFQARLAPGVLEWKSAGRF